MLISRENGDIAAAVNYLFSLIFKLYRWQHYLICGGLALLIGRIVFIMAQGVDTSKKAPSQQKPIEKTGDEIGIVKGPGGVVDRHDTELEKDGGGIGLENDFADEFCRRPEIFAGGAVFLPALCAGLCLGGFFFGHDGVPSFRGGGRKTKLSNRFS